MKRLACILLFFFCAAPCMAAETLVPRTIIALYDSRGYGIPNSYLHTMAEMPLNHLGLTLEYHDIQHPLPDIAGRKDVRGVISWFFSDTRLDPETYLHWAIRAVDSGKKFVVMGPLGVAQDAAHYSSAALVNRFLGKIGVKMTGGWVDNPFDVTYDYLNPGMLATGHPFDWTRPSYPVVQAVDAGTVQLAARSDVPTHRSDLIVTSPTGGYIAANYIFRTSERPDDDINQWLINPFAFFRAAFATDDLPKPDTTTIAGRRMYYSQIDGDGVNNVTQVEEYRAANALSSQVIMDKAIKAYPDMPVTVTAIAADIDPDWAAVQGSRRVMQEIFALPQVEAGSHTYSHPFFWQLFEGNDGWKNETAYLKLYKTLTWKPKENYTVTVPPPAIPAGYTVPRAYAREPFNIHKEIEGSVQEISALLPPGKKVRVLNWSGNCLPWEEAVRLTREAGLQNINGGDGRSDPDYPGYASLAPIGRPVGRERQIYASTSNEISYTNLWAGNFQAFGYLVKTLQNSETPIRVKPIDIYYHFYSGERAASLNALLTDINYAHAQDIAPVSTSHFTKIAGGFYGTRMISLAPNTWRIENRGALQTIRFDHSTFKTLDFERSKGVVGQRHFQGSLYVYLDEAAAAPVIALKETGNAAPPAEPAPYLVESRWLISGLHRGDSRVDFTAQGFGDGEMTWEMPAPGRYRVSVDGKPQDTVSTDGHALKLKLKDNAMEPRHITIAPLASTSHA